MNDCQRERLLAGLENLRQRFDARYLAPDPLQFPRRFTQTEDREVVGLVAASLAYGNVTSICASVERVLAWIGPQPGDFVANFEPRWSLKTLGAFKHRWSTARDVVCLLYFARQMIREAGSIGEFFHQGYDASDEDVGKALERFSARALALDPGGLYGGRRLSEKAGVRYFFPSPKAGSACKRLNMYLRWMVRPDDGLDFGIWDFARPAQLIMPLDTHLSRIGCHLGWTARKSPGWKMAVDVTRFLARVAPEDPVRYDFALSRMGILERCPRHPRGGRCDLCALRRSLYPGRRVA